MATLPYLLPGCLPWYVLHWQCISATPQHARRHKHMYTHSDSRQAGHVTPFQGRLEQAFFSTTSLPPPQFASAESCSCKVDEVFHSFFQRLVLVFLFRSHRSHWPFSPCSCSSSHSFSVAKFLSTLPLWERASFFLPFLPCSPEAFLIRSCSFLGYGLRACAP